MFAASSFQNTGAMPQLHQMIASCPFSGSRPPTVERVESTREPRCGSSAPVPPAFVSHSVLAWGKVAARGIGSLSPQTSRNGRSRPGRPRVRQRHAAGRLGGSGVRVAGPAPQKPHATESQRWSKDASLEEEEWGLTTPSIHSAVSRSYANTCRCPAASYE